jgi:hypothetical protein
LELPGGEGTDRPAPEAFQSDRRQSFSCLLAGCLIDAAERASASPGAEQHGVSNGEREASIDFGSLRQVAEVAAPQSSPVNHARGGLEHSDDRL